MVTAAEPAEREASRKEASEELLASFKTWSLQVWNDMTVSTDASTPYTISKLKPRLTSLPLTRLRVRSFS
jgi:hypothetical protein